MGLVRSFIGTDGIWQYIPHINTGLFSIIKVHFLLFANLIVDWHINTINFTDSGSTKGLCMKFSYVQSGYLYIGDIKNADRADSN